MDLSRLNRADSPWWFAYYLASAHSVEQRGYSKMQRARQELAKGFVSTVLDSGMVSSNGFPGGSVYLGAYRRGVQKANGDSPQSYQELMDLQRHTGTIATSIDNVQTTFDVTPGTAGWAAGGANCDNTAGGDMWLDAGVYTLINPGQSNAEVVQTATLGTGNCTGTGISIQRGMLNTFPQAHSAGEPIEVLFVQASSPFWSSQESGQNLQSMGALAAASDVYVPDSITGATLSGLRAYEVMHQTARYLDYATDGTCTTQGSPEDNCQNYMWRQSPPHTISNLRLNDRGGGSTEFVFTAPDTNACKIGLSATPFTSTDDANDVTIAAGPASRSYVASGLSGTQYYRITCGPQGGTARITGTFTTLN
jgi:hypothetical protein